MQISENDSYLDYYIKKLNNNEYPIQSFNLDSLLFKRNIDKFLKNDFSLIKKNFNILELNFSSCNLNDQNSIKLISNCSILNSNISKINLSLNLITENIYDLLINNNINKLLYKLTELDLSYNSIKIIKLKKYNKNWQAHENLLTKFISHFPQLELLILKGTPCEDKFNEYVKKEVTAYMEKVKKGKISDKSKNELKELTEIRDIFEKKYLQVNPNFHLKINDFITIKYVKRMKQVDYIDLNNIIFDNVRPEENKQY